MSNLSIDLNLDCGEYFSQHNTSNDISLLPHVSSANIATGFHAGDPSSMRRTVQLALQHRVAIGAHPSFADIAGFGRRNQQLSPQEVYDLIVYQVGALQAIVHTEGARLHHVKPHGALYNMAARDAELADAIVRAVRDVNPALCIYGLASSELTAAAQRQGMKAVHEGFADRHYEPDGTLISRQVAGSVLSNAQEAAERVVQMVLQREVLAIDGVTVVSLQLDSVCIHGDHPRAQETLQQIRKSLSAANIDVKKVQHTHADA